MPTPPIRRILLVPCDGIAALTEPQILAFFLRKKRKAINLNPHIRECLAWSSEKVMADMFLLQTTNHHECRKHIYEPIYYLIRGILEKQVSNLVGFDYLSRVERGIVQCRYNGLTLTIAITETNNE